LIDTRLEEQESSVQLSGMLLKEVLLVKMKGILPEEEQKYQKKHDSWGPSPPRMGRAQRPILLAICAVALICLLQYGAPGSIHRERSLWKSSTIDRRSQRHGNIGSSEQGSSERIAVEAASHRVDAKDFVLTEEDPSDPQYVGPKEESIHPLRLGDEIVFGHENYEHDDHILEQITDKENALAEEDTETDKEKATEEHNPDHNSDTRQEMLSGETVKAPQEPKNGKEGIIASSDTDPKQDTKILEKEPEDHLSLEEKGEALPEILHIPLEDAVSEQKLTGWEDDWVAHASFDVKKWGSLEEPKIDFVYLWVNGSEEAFQATKHPFEENSILNDPEGVWIKSHGVNRYRDWDELKYSLRSLEAHASGFRNKVQILVNSVEGTKDKKQVPSWLNDRPATKEVVQVLAQEDFFDVEKHVCLPTFNSLTIENQIFNVSLPFPR
jgi:hypothetical protein